MMLFYNMAAGWRRCQAHAQVSRPGVPVISARCVRRDTPGEHDVNGCLSPGTTAAKLVRS
jgi:hypothetical protein